MICGMLISWSSVQSRKYPPMSSNDQSAHALNVVAADCMASAHGQSMVERLAFSTSIDRCSTNVVQSSCLPKQEQTWMAVPGMAE